MTGTKARSAVTAWGIWPRAAFGAALALAGNLAVWAIAATAGVEVMITEPPNMDVYVSLTAVNLVLSSLVPAALAAIGLVLLSRLNPPRSLRIFQIVVTVLTLLSLGAPLTLDVDTGNRLALSAMHLVTGAAVIVAQSWGTRNDRARLEPTDG